ncbi:hypothetical protein MY04_4137 [Flammeovirga sp. MY04]|uniref:hypothetical protein n=1 Tax=Flammeovirga sp. MY04 TaxID=1191459 RepID=UPI000806382A|nr:hypothetical protein [Flammeovirga sp. MY04]ANQ51481.1 hypothetical protein MY04_4137 [Flammeovirga sp. MY04]
MSSSFKTNFYVSFGIAAIMGLLLFIQTTNALISGILTLILGTLSFIFGYVGDYLGEKRHYSVINSNGFLGLINDGFRVEKKERYVGLTGTYNGYIVDIYYDWSTVVKPRVHKAFVINFYFQPIKGSDEFKDDIYNQFVDRHKVSNFGFYPHQYWWKDGMLSVKIGATMWNPSRKKLIKYLEKGSEILQKERLRPLEKEALRQHREEYPYHLVPEIDLYFKQEEVEVF